MAMDTRMNRQLTVIASASSLADDRLGEGLFPFCRQRDQPQIAAGAIEAASRGAQASSGGNLWQPSGPSGRASTFITTAGSRLP